MKNSQHLLRMLKEAGTPQLVARHPLHIELPTVGQGTLPLVGGDEKVRTETVAQQVAHHLRPFGHKEVLLTAVLGLFKLADELYLVLANHLLGLKFKV